jgi:hypothetical protein
MGRGGGGIAGIGKSKSLPLINAGAQIRNGNPDFHTKVSTPELNLLSPYFSGMM